MEIMKTITGKRPWQLAEVTRSINTALIKYEINTKLRIAHFMSQLLHESLNLKSNQRKFKLLN
jgi:predicted chitinase